MSRVRWQRFHSSAELIYIKSGATPRVAIVLMLLAIAMLVGTHIDPKYDVPPRYLIVLLYFLTSVSDLIKERMMFGRGDAVTLFGAFLIVAATVAAAVDEQHATHHISRLSAVSLLAAAFTIFIVLVNVRRRLNRAYPPD